MTSHPQPTVRALGERLSAALGTRVSDLRRLSGGASRQTWAFVGTAADGSRSSMVLHLEPPAERRSGASAEAEVLRAARRAGVPVPEVFRSDVDGDAIGVPFLVVGGLSGTADVPSVLRGLVDQRARSRLLEQLGRALAMLHTVPRDEVPSLPARDIIDECRTMLRGVTSRHPTLEAALRWLEDTRPAPWRIGVVHGDFRLGNVLVDGDRLVAVIDWEAAHIGDVLEDLGWMCQPSWRYGSALPAAGLGTIEELLKAYGADIDPRTFEWWIAAATLKWGAYCAVLGEEFIDGTSTELEYAAIGRRVCEIEDDLLGWIDKVGGSTAAGSSSAEPPDRPDSHFDDPSAEQILAAVSQFLRDEVLANMPDELKRATRIAARLVTIVGRQLENRHLAADYAAALGAARSPRTIADGLAAGTLDHRSPELLNLLRLGVRMNLSAFNPGYRHEGWGASATPPGEGS